MKILSSLYTEILHCYSPVPPESGGIIGEKNGVVCRYYHDNSVDEHGMYLPNTAKLECVIADWQTESIAFCGIIHNHFTAPTLSGADRLYVEKILRSQTMAPPLLYFPIVWKNEKIYVYKAAMQQSGCRIEQEELVLLSDICCQYEPNGL